MAIARASLCSRLHRDPIGPYESNWPSHHLLRAELLRQQVRAEAVAIPLARIYQGNKAYCAINGKTEIWIGGGLARALQVVLLASVGLIVIEIHDHFTNYRTAPQLQPTNPQGS